MSATGDGAGRPKSAGRGGARGPKATPMSTALIRTTSTITNGDAHRGRTVAITGSLSFLGRNLIGLLEEDERIRRIVSIDIATPRTAGHKTFAYEVDLTQPTAEDRVTEILAAEEVD